MLAAETRPGEIVLLTDLQASAVSPASLRRAARGRPPGRRRRRANLGHRRARARPAALVRRTAGGSRCPLAGDSGAAPPRSSRRLGDAAAAPGARARRRRGRRSRCRARRRGWWPLTRRARSRRAPARRPARGVGAGGAGGARRAGTPADRYVAAACEVLRGQPAGSRAASEVTLGRLGPGRSIVQPPADPAALGALNRALAARGVAWRYGDARSPARRHRQRRRSSAAPRVLRRYALRAGRAAGAPACSRPSGGEPWIVRERRRRAARQPARPGVDRRCRSRPGSCRSWTCCSTALARGELALARRRAGRSGAAARPGHRGAPGRARLAGRGRRRVPRRPSRGVYYLLAGARHDRRDQREPRPARVAARAGHRRAGAAALAGRRGWSRSTDAGDGGLRRRRARRPPRARSCGRRCCSGWPRSALASAWRRQRMSFDPVLDAFGRTPAAPRPGRAAARPAAQRSGSAGCRARAARCWPPGWRGRFPQRLLTVVAPDAGRRRALAHRPGAPHRRAASRSIRSARRWARTSRTTRSRASAPRRSRRCSRGRLRILVTTARATAERTLVPAALERLRLELAVGRARARRRESWRALERDGLPPGADGHRGGRVQRARRHRGRVRLRHGGAGAAGVVGRRDLARSAGSTSPPSARGEELSEVTVLPIDARAVRRDAADGGPRAPAARRPTAARCSSSSPPTPSSRGSRRSRRRRGRPRLARGGAPSRDRPPAGRGRAEPRANLRARRPRGARGSRRFPRLLLRDEPADLQFGLLPAGADRPGPQPAPRAARRRARRRSSSATTRASSSGSRSCSRRAAARRTAPRSRSARSTAAS